LSSKDNCFRRCGGRGPTPLAKSSVPFLQRLKSSSVEEIMACLPFYTQGEIVKGFGRGSKELGIPTANLSESVVDSLPKALTTGIYFGLSNVDDGEVYKTVLSIGWNPFYNNTKKSLEAHLLHAFPKDFYGSKLRLIILGYIRPEMNYDSLEKLIEAINSDIAVAKDELDKSEFSLFYNDKFFSMPAKDGTGTLCNGN